MAVPGHIPSERTLIVDVRAGYAGRPGVDAGQQNRSSRRLRWTKKAGLSDVDKYRGTLRVNLEATNGPNGGNDSFGIRGAAPRDKPKLEHHPERDSV